MKLQLYHSDKYANVGPRLVAALIDWLLFGLPTVAGIFWLLSQPSLSDVIAAFFTFLAVIFIPTTFAQFAYYFVSLAKWGKTLGKAVVGLEVLDEKEQTLSYSQAFMRENVTKGISGTLLGAGFWAAAFHPQHRAWHDEFAGSFVYQRENRTLLGVLAVVGLIALYIMAGVKAIQLVNQAPAFKEILDIISLLPQTIGL